MPLTISLLRPDDLLSLEIGELEDFAESAVLMPESPPRAD